MADNQYEKEADDKTRQAQKLREAGHRQNVADDRKDAANEAQKEADKKKREAGH